MHFKIESTCKCGWGNSKPLQPQSPVYVNSNYEIVRFKKRKAKDPQIAIQRSKCHLKHFLMNLGRQHFNDTSYFTRQWRLEAIIDFENVGKAITLEQMERINEIIQEVLTP